MPRIIEILTNLEQEHRLRTLPDIGEKDFIDLSSNDYLSLGTRCNEFKEEFLSRYGDTSFSSSASRLLSTKHKYHCLLENYLEELYGKPALLFNSGYHANVGCIGALTLPSTLFLCDKLIHASIIDGLKISGSEFKRFHHNDLDKLRKLLDKTYKDFERIIIVVESIYSMDGDEAPLPELVELKNYYPNVMLYVDEAHAFGTRGKQGLGISEEKGVVADIDVVIGTFGKAAASVGAFAICNDIMKSFLINTARPFIFSTALPPINVAWSMLMTEKIVGMTKERQHLANLSHRFTDKLKEITGQYVTSTSQIIPLLTGSAEKALSIASQLHEQGFHALPIRRPTVPPGGERIRFSLNAGLDFSRLESLFNILKSMV